MLGAMPGIISGRDWRETRLRHLQAALEGDLNAEDRTAIQAEIEELRREAKAGKRGRLRWLIIGGRLPEP
jgi:hypothetical protein